jgi:chromosome partitioning protein
MQTLALANQKGGCGKTTVAVNAASALAARGQRVLLIDLDPQGHATLGLGQADFAGVSVADVFCRGLPISRAARVIDAGLQLVPGSLELAEFEEVATHALEAERVLERALEEVAPLFDWVVLDCPTRADGVLAANAVRAASLVVLVVETGAFALQGAIRAQHLFTALARENDRELDLRVLATLFDPASELSREVLIGVHARFGERMFDTVIHCDEGLREAIAYGVPVRELAPGGPAARRFDALAAELLVLADQRAARRPGARRAAPNPPVSGGV